MTLEVVTLGLKRPLDVEVSQITAPFWSGLAEGKFLLARCTVCSRHSFPPRQICPKCHSRDFEWVEASGDATVYSFTRIHNTPTRYNLLNPNVVAIIDLVEGVRLLTRILTSEHPIVVGGPCRLVITSHPDGEHYAAMVLAAS